MTQKHSHTKTLLHREILKNISAQDFLNFGMQQVAYIRRDQEEGEGMYAVHAADGTPISVMDSMDAAVIVARYNDLEPVVVH